MHGRAAHGCPGTNGGGSSWTRRLRYSYRRATTPQPWTRSPSGPASASPSCTSTSPASSSCTWPRSTTENKQRVAATFSAYFEYVESEGQAYRLVFESDLSNEAAVRDRLERGQRECADMISPMIRQDAGLDDAEAHLVSVAMVGLAQVTARYWLSTTREHIPRETAEQLVARLAWRGISGWPRN